MEEKEPQVASGLVKGVADGEWAGAASLDLLAQDLLASIRDRAPGLR